MNEHRLIVAAAGILTDGDNVLACQRHRSDPYALQWEFPGGKVEPGEDLESALKRELAEELGIDASIGEEVFRFKHRYPDRFVQMVFFHVPFFLGEIVNRVFETIEWIPRSELPAYNFLEADRDLVLRIARGEIV
jgi:8-oxo-dGTP diphosphatase